MSLKMSRINQRTNQSVFPARHVSPPRGSPSGFIALSHELTRIRGRLKPRVDRTTHPFTSSLGTSIGLRREAETWHLTLSIHSNINHAQYTCLIPSTLIRPRSLKLDRTLIHQCEVTRFYTQSPAEATPKSLNMKHSLYCLLTY